MSDGKSNHKAEVIDLVHSDDDDNDNNSSPKDESAASASFTDTNNNTKRSDKMDDHENRAAKKPRAQTSPTESLSSSSSSSSPIQLFATLLDVEERQKHGSDSDCDTHPSWTQCRTLRQLLGVEDDTGRPSHRGIDWLVVANFIIDYRFLLLQVPELLSVPNVTVFYATADTPEEIWKQAAVSPDAVDFVCLDPSWPLGSGRNPLPYRIPYGMHHSKIFLVGFSDGRLRVVIHTANLRAGDVYLKAQAAYVQEFPLQTSTSSSSSTATVATMPNSSTSGAFQDDLISYFQTYQYSRKRPFFPTGTRPETSLCDCLRQYDYSSACVVLIPSTPGYHRLDTAAADRRGHVKLKHAIAEHCRRNRTSSSSSTATAASPIICQFSSMGSLSSSYLEQLQASMDVQMAQRPIDERPDPKKKPPLSQLRIVYPTVQEIRTSVEGYQGGASVPGQSKNVNKAFMKSLYHKWASTSSSGGSNNNNPLNKSHHVPHIKTYYQIRCHTDDASSSMECFVLSSHNLSKAAWGEIQNSARGRRLFVRHWELGVFLSPSLLQCQRLVAFGQASSSSSNSNDKIATVPLPYSFVPEPYGRNDLPWAVDQMYPEADQFGRRSAGF